MGWRAGSLSSPDVLLRPSAISAKDSAASAVKNSGSNAKVAGEETKISRSEKVAELHAYKAPPPEPSSSRCWAALIFSERIVSRLRSAATFWIGIRTFADCARGPAARGRRWPAGRARTGIPRAFRKRKNLSGRGRTGASVAGLVQSAGRSGAPRVSRTEHGHHRFAQGGGHVHG